MTHYSPEEQKNYQENQPTSLKKNRINCTNLKEEKRSKQLCFLGVLSLCWCSGVQVSRGNMATPSPIRVQFVATPIKRVFKLV